MIYWNNKNYKGNFVKSGKRMFDPHMECPKCQEAMLYQIGNDKLKCGNCGNVIDMEKMDELKLYTSSRRFVKSGKMPYIDDEDIDKFEKRLNEGEEVKMKGWTFRKDDTGRISVIDPDGNLLDKDFKSVASFIDWFRYWKKDSLKSSRKVIKSSNLPEEVYYIVINGAKQYFEDREKAKEMAAELGVGGVYTETDPEEIEELYEVGYIGNSRKAIKSGYYDNKNILGVEIVENEQLIEANLKEDGVEINWNKISDVLSHIEYSVENNINRQIAHKAVEEFHDDNVYGFTYWFEEDDSKTLDFIKTIINSADDDFERNDETVFTVHNISDVVSTDALEKELEQGYDDLGLIVLESCDIEFSVPNKFVNNKLYVESSRQIKSAVDGLTPDIICDRIRSRDLNLDNKEYNDILNKINAFEDAWDTYRKSWELFSEKYTLADIEEMYNEIEHLLEDEDKQVVEDWIEDIDEVFFSNKPLSKMSLNYGTTGNDIIESSKQSHKSRQVKQSHVADINYYKQLVKSVLSNRMTEDEALKKIAVRNNCNKKYAESILNNWMDKYKEQFIKSDAEIADIMKEFDVDGDLNSWAEDYMPGSGKANTKGGELVRAAQRILTEYYDNGNMIGRGLGNETVNPAARYIVEKTNFDGNGEIEDMLNHLVQMDDNEYNSWCKRFEVDFADWLRSKGDLFEQPNEDDISDYAEDTDKEFFINKFYVEDSFGNQYWFDKEEDEFVCTEIQFAEDSTYSEDDVLKDGDEFTSEIDKTEDYGTFEKDGFIYDWEASGTQDENGNYSEWKIVRVTISDQLFENDDTFDFDKVDDYNIFDINGNELKENDLLSL